MDTISTITEIVTTVSKTNFTNLDYVGWILLFCGWLLYWMKTMNQCRIDKNGEPFIGFFFRDNMFEIPTSVISCFVLAILGNHIPSDLLDMSGRLSTLMIGYASSSILNGLITMSKKK